MMRLPKKKRWMPVLMIATVVAIAGFQTYWISKTYEREKFALERNTNMLFRETIRGLQTAKLKLERLSAPDSNTRIFLSRELRTTTKGTRIPRDKMASLIDVVLQKAGDSSRPKYFLHAEGDSLRLRSQAMSPRQNRIIQFLADVESLQDSIRVKEIETAYAKRLGEQKIDVPFSVGRVETVDSDKPVYNEVTLGFAQPITYKLSLGNTFPHLLKRIWPALLFSLFLVGFTLLSFLLLYRNLLRQQKLADIKNEFISNITHELKTPIATVSVAIEALRNFSASLDPQKTKEYLDISANELQRLSLLVDKVLKLSMFEKKEIELKYEPLNLRQLVEEVTSSMRLQFEKRKAQVNVEQDGAAELEGDRLHLVSVLFNLLDNALKYTTGRPIIDISIADVGSTLRLEVSDNGVGIPPEYRQRVFEKFFRVPHGNLHNAKGYGLGLSYVSHVVEQHKGTIHVETSESGGSRFVIVLPRQQRPFLPEIKQAQLSSTALQQNN